MFKKATREQAKARIALMGPPGSGKSWTSLLLAKHLAGPTGKIAVIDSERGSASKYAGIVADFDVCEPETFGPMEYVALIKGAEKAGYDVLVIDSLSHTWSGKGGALELVDQAAKRSKSGNSYTAWRDVTPMHNQLVDAMLQFKGHVIATLRTKVEYTLEEDPRTGKKVPRKVGMAPIHREGLEFEFDVVGDMDVGNTLVVTKSRCPSLTNAVIEKPGEDFADTIKTWLSDGEAPKPKATAPRAAQPRSAAPSPVADSDKPEWLSSLEAANDVTALAEWAEREKPTLLALDQASKRAAWKAVSAKCEAFGLDTEAAKLWFVDQKESA